VSHHAASRRPLARQLVAWTGQVVLTLTALLGLMSIVLAAATVAFDVQPLVVRSGSMSPAVPTGALAVAREVPASDVRVGDIVSVHTAEGDRVTHRVVSVDAPAAAGGPATLRLKGDANANPDQDPYLVSTVDRVVLDVPWAGYLASWMSGPLGIFLLGLFAALVGSALVGRLRAPRPPSRGGARRATAGAASLVLVAAAGTAISAGATETTWAAWSDTATTTSGAFSAHRVLGPDAATCVDGGTSLSGGYYTAVTLGFPHKDTRYDYVLRISRTPDGVKVGDDIPISATGAAGSPVATTLTASVVASRVTLGSPVYVRVHARLKGATTWSSAGYRQWRVDTARVGITARNAVKCVAQVAQDDRTGPAITFTAPTNGATGRHVPYQSVVRDACGTATPACGTVSDESGVASVTYQLKREGNTLGTRYFHPEFGGVWNTDGGFESADRSGSTWLLDGLITTAYVADGTFTLTVRATDHGGNVSEASIRFTLT
jgi:signal peptidase I